jgi:carbamoyltransferase
MTNERFSQLFGEPVRTPRYLLTSFHMDIAASIQTVLDEAARRLTHSLPKE